jgi:hypothetical protein
MKTTRDQRVPLLSFSFMVLQEITSLGGNKSHISPKITAASLSITEGFVGQKTKANRVGLNSWKI